jgi:hypothetical protein
LWIGELPVPPKEVIAFYQRVYGKRATSNGRQGPTIDKVVTVGLGVAGDRTQWLLLLTPCPDGHTLLTARR